MNPAASVNLMKVIRILLLLVIMSSSASVWAQSQSTFKRTTATILFASIGGGVLGLSTLSFYGLPQEHTDNITTGVLIGFIAGLSFVMYDNYTQQNAKSEPLSTTQKQLLVSKSEWTNQNKKRGPDYSWPLFNYEFTF